MLRTTALTTLLACAAAAETPPPSPWEYIHPKAVVIGGIEWHKASQSPFLRDLKNELGPSLKFSMKGDPRAIDALEAVYFSAADLPDKADIKTTSGLALVRTRTEIAPLLSSLAQRRIRRQNYNGTTVLIPEVDKSTDWRIALLDARHALMGDWPSVRAVLNRTGPPAETPLIARAKQLAATADVWFVADDPGHSAPANPMLAEIRGVDAAVSLGTRAEMVIQLATESAEKATALATALQMMSGALPAKPKTLTIGSVDTTVRITARSTAAELKAATTAFGDRFKAAVRGDTPAATPVAMREPALPPEKQVIRIHGLDEGVREIPLKP